MATHRPWSPPAFRLAAIIPLLAAILAASCPDAAHSKQATLILDPGLTRIRFSLGARLHTVHGTARLSAGEIRFDPEGGRVEGRIVVDARSARTGIGKRDRKMHKEVLESGEYPEIVFTPSRIAGAVPRSGKGKIRLSGTVLLHGAEHPVEIPLDVTIAGTECDAAGSFVVPYVAWGLKDPSNLVLPVAKRVTVEIHVSGAIDYR